MTEAALLIAAGLVVGYWLGRYDWYRATGLDRLFYTYPISTKLPTNLCAVPGCWQPEEAAVHDEPAAPDARGSDSS